jgi:CBS domain-containing protein
VLLAMKVGEIMSRPAITVSAETGIKAAAILLAEHGVSALPVVDANGGAGTRLAESVALIVPGVLEVRFAPRAPAREP